MREGFIFEKMNYRYFQSQLDATTKTTLTGYSFSPFLLVVRAKDLHTCGVRVVYGAHVWSPS